MGEGADDSTGGSLFAEEPPCATDGLPAECPRWCEHANPPPIVTAEGEPPEVGSLLTGGYLLREEIGHGGMGRVFAASTLMGQVVAVKVLRDNLIGCRGAHLRFVGEARAMGRVEHPNVLRLLDSHEDAPAPFFVTELVGGVDLRDFICEAGPYGIPLERALLLLESVCAGVTAIHAAGVVHLDLKPSNVLVDRSDRVVICDFGLARPCAPPCRFPDGELAGTPGFIAPEVAEGVQPSPRPAADVYAVAVIAYELLTGAPVFEPASTTRRGELPHALPVVPPRELNPEIPKALGDMLVDALDRSPHVRPTAADLLRAVRTCAA